MSTKLFALGNVLRMDDGIAIRVAKNLEAELNELGIEVIFGETDISYCLSMVSDEDYLILVDASCFGKQAGEITVLSLQESIVLNPGKNQHELNFIRLLQLCRPRQEGSIVAIEAEETGFGLELSNTLQLMLEEITDKTLAVIKKG